MSLTPAISVIIPAHNQERYIGRCLRSILSQTRARAGYEVIVVDDGSRDRPAYALQLFENEVQLIRHAECQGLPASLNAGIRAARGRFIVRVDADDYVHHEYLNILAMHLEMNNAIDAVACDYYVVDNEEQVLEQMNCMDRPIGCGIMFRIDQLIDIGLYDENFLMREEEDLRLRFEDRFKISRISLPLYRYRQHDDNMTNDEAGMARYANELRTKHEPGAPDA